MRYLDGRLTAAEAEELHTRLREDAKAQAWLWEVAAQVTAMGELARQRTALQPNASPLPKLARKRRPFCSWAIVALALWLLLAAGLLLWPHARGERFILDVLARQAVVASLDTKAQLQATTPQAPPKDWQWDLSSSPPSNWRGEWLPADGETPARVRAVACPVGRCSSSRIRDS